MGYRKFQTAIFFTGTGYRNNLCIGPDVAFDHFQIKVYFNFAPFLVGDKANVRTFCKKGIFSQYQTISFTNSCLLKYLNLIFYFQIEMHNAITAIGSSKQYIVNALGAKILTPIIETLPKTNLVF